MASAGHLLRSARRLLSHVADLHRIARTSGDTVGGDLRLGSFIRIAPTFLPGLVADLKQSSS